MKCQIIAQVQSLMQKCKGRVAVFVFDNFNASMVVLQIARVGQKRGRDSDVDELEVYEDGQARKKSRVGWPAQQWITIYNKHVPMKQRYLLSAVSAGLPDTLVAIRCLGTCPHIRQQRL